MIGFSAPRAAAVLGLVAALSTIGANAPADAAVTACAVPAVGRDAPAAEVARTDPVAFADAARNAGRDLTGFRALAGADRSLWLSSCGTPYFRDAAPSPAPRIAPRSAPRTAPRAASRSLPPLADTLALESLPGAPYTIFLDVDGGSVHDTMWQDGDQIDVKPYSLDAQDDADFSDAELTEIRKLWAGVAEDFAPFDVNVTTRDPGEAAIDRDDANDPAYGVHVMVTKGGRLQQDCTCAGEAPFDGFKLTGSSRERATPVWVFTEGSGTDGYNLAVSASHEIGHYLGLSHDGDAASSYDRGAPPWAPLMGVGYYEPVTQWSEGEYPDATNQEDDIAIIARRLPVRADDHGDTAASATALSNGSDVDGLISTRADVDAFQFTGRGATTVTVSPAPFAPNLDVRMRILDASGAVVADVDPPVAKVSDSEASGLGATWTGDLPAGTYTVLVEGVGTGDPAVLGKYSDYGSLGRYDIALQTTDLPPVPRAVRVRPQVIRVRAGSPVAARLHATGGTGSYRWSATRLPHGLRLSPSGRLTGALARAGRYEFTGTARSGPATGSGTIRVVVEPRRTEPVKAAPAGGTRPAHVGSLPETGAPREVLGIGVAGVLSLLAGVLLLLGRQRTRPGTDAPSS